MCRQPSTAERRSRRADETAAHWHGAPSGPTGRYRAPTAQARAVHRGRRSARPPDVMPDSFSVIRFAVLDQLWNFSPEGQRCRFNGRDISGLRFGNQGDPPIDLNGADFTQANLSGTEADNILIHHCSFNGAIFDNCYWRQPVFAFADLRRVSAKQATWGTPNPPDTFEPPRADFSHATLHDADLTEAKISGFFSGTSLFGARLCHADLSYNTFFGPLAGLADRRRCTQRQPCSRQRESVGFHAT